MGEFNHTNYRQWAKCGWAHAHGVGPGELGCPWQGGASRLLPKAAAGISPSKPMHDDNNGVLSLSCWTSLTEADEPTCLVFSVNGHEVRIQASALRSVLFMGYIPHETRAANPMRRATTARVRNCLFQLLTDVMSDVCSNLRSPPRSSPGAPFCFC